MIREGWSLYAALVASGRTPAPRSSAVKTPGRTGGPLARVLLDQEGSVVGIEVVRNEDWNAFWTLNDNSGISWPVLRPKQPSLADGEQAASLRDQAKEAKQPVQRQTLNATLENLLAESQAITPTALTEAICSGATKHKPRLDLATAPPEVIELMRRTEAIPADAARTMIGFAQKDPALADWLFSFAAGEGEPGKTGFKAGQIALDLAESKVYSSDVRARFEAFLATASAQQGDGILCSLSGRAGTRHLGNFPSITLPVVGPKGTAMYSMTKEARANYRYGLTESELACIASETVQGALDALNYVTQESHRRKHSRPIANGKGERDLLIVYAENVPEDTEEAGFATDPDEPTASYEDALLPILEALSGTHLYATEAKVHLIVLRAVSPGQTQAVYARVPDAAKVYQAGKRWLEAQRRRPPLLCEWRNQEGKRRLISPEMAIFLLSKQWSEDESRDSSIQAPSPAEILDFLLAEGSEREALAKELLGLAVVRGEGLLTGIGGAYRSPQPPYTADLPPKGDKRGRITRSGYADRFAYLLTLLLDACDRHMDTRPHPPAYLLGLLLALTDTLQKSYGVVVRDSVPPTLAGNGLLGIAKDQPARALTELLDRIRPWQAWAETASVERSDKPNDVKRAKKALSRLSSVASSLSGQLPQRMTDLDRAELLLGYLSKDDVADTLPDDEPATSPES